MDSNAMNYFYIFFSFVTQMTAAFSEKMTDFNIFLDGIIINFDFCLDFHWSEKKIHKKKTRSLRRWEYI